MQYIPMYSKIVRDIEKLLKIKPQVFIEDTKLTNAGAWIIAVDLNLYCIHNEILQRFYFRKERYKQLKAHETFIR